MKKEAHLTIEPNTSSGVKRADSTNRPPKNLDKNMRELIEWCDSNLFHGIKVK